MVILIIAGVLFAVFGGYISRRQLLLRRKGQRVTGTVTGIDRQWNQGGRDNAGGYTYSPVLSFQTLAGQQIETKSATGGSSPGAEVGQQVRVLYDPANPSTAELDTFSAQATALLVPLLCAGAGVAVIIVGIVGEIHG
jgi:hypothetical protein